MESSRIILSGIWVATMLVYLLGDVLRIFSGDVEFGKLDGIAPSPRVWLGIAVLMLIPIVMVVLSLTVSYPAIRWITFAVAGFQIVFNLFGLPYKGAYDNFLIVVSLVFNGLAIWYAWKWV
jgi:hypothetical protein